MSLDVCLVNMPFAATGRPSIGLSLLQSALRTAEIETRILYANLAFAEQVGHELQELICGIGPEKLLGEWVFAAAAFPEMERRPGDIRTLAREADPHGRARQALGGAELGDVAIRLREIAPRFVDQMARVVLAARPRIVGCTSLFQQHTAALALLRRIRELAPEVVTMIGGANCEGPMGQVIARRFPWVDVVVSGEADELIVPLVRQLRERGREVDPSTLPPGVITAEHAAEHSTRAPAPRGTVRAMDRLPIPDYDDYFLALRASPLGPWIQPSLLVETSRGCWWGEVSHCTFCGLNGSGLAYRSKSPERALFELDALAERYGLERFEVVDNILDMGYLKNLLPTLEARGAPYSLFYETKANLKREQVERLVRAGVNAIQPGIEGLHGEALDAVDKGTTVMHNLQLMKWARQYGLRLLWNLLTGLPGEDDRWWRETAAWLEQVEHLEPPSGVTSIHFQRYSPYHFRADDFGLDLVPSRAYRSIFPLPEDELADLAYFFEDRAGAVPPPGAGRRQLETAVGRWIAASRAQPRLEWRAADKRSIHVLDTRRCAVARTQRLDGAAAALLRELEAARGRVSVLRRLEGRGFERGELEDALADLLRRRLVLEEDGRLISLAVDANPAADAVLGLESRTLAARAPGP